jgi:magnesium transporter
MDRDHRERLEQALSYPEDSAGRLMNTDVITVRADVNIDVVLRYLRLRGEMPEHTDYLYVVSRRNQYMGRISVSDLLTKDPSTAINELINDEQPGIPLDTPDNEVATQFSDHDWISAPVVDANNILLGRITIDDVVDIIRGQAEHQALSAVGLDEDEDLFSPVPRAAKRRALWLGINLATAFLASWVIGQFEDTLQKIVPLAILMPIVASMGGVAATQTLTLMVRGIALGQVGLGNLKALFNKETLVGFINGIVWAIVVGVISALWFEPKIGMVIAAAMLINLVVAALAGVAVPLLLKRMDIDPALAGGVVVTTVTDVMGFLAFLGLGTWILVGNPA